MAKQIRPRALQAPVDGRQQPRWLRCRRIEDQHDGARVTIAPAAQLDTW